MFTDDNPSDDDTILPYGTEDIEVKTNEVDSTCIEAMDEYIGAQVVIPEHDNITPSLATVK